MSAPQQENPEPVAQTVGEIDLEHPAVPPSTLTTPTTGAARFAWFIERPDMDKTKLKVVRLLDGSLVHATNIYDRASNRPIGGKYLGQGHVLGLAGELQIRAIVDQDMEKERQERIQALQASVSSQNVEINHTTIVNEAPTVAVVADSPSSAPSSARRSSRLARITRKKSVSLTSSDSDSDVPVRDLIGNAAGLVDVSFQLEQEARHQRIQAETDVKKAEADLLMAKQRQKALDKQLKVEAKASSKVLKAEAKGLKKDAKIEAKIAKKGSLSADVALEASAGEGDGEAPVTRRRSLRNFFRRSSSKADLSLEADVGVTA